MWTRSVDGQQTTVSESPNQKPTMCVHRKIHNGPTIKPKGTKIPIVDEYETPEIKMQQIPTRVAYIEWGSDWQTL